MSKTSLLEFAKNSRRNCMETKEELEETINDTIKVYKEIIFGSDTPVCMACLNKLRKQHIIDQYKHDKKLMNDMKRKLAWKGLQKNILIDGDTMIDKRKSVMFGPEINSTYWKDKF